MPWILTILALIVAWHLFMRKYGALGFWKVARKYPYAAHEMFQDQDCWHVFTEEREGGWRASLQPGDWAGPFKLVFPMTGNRPLTIFGKVPEYEEAQKEFVRRMTQSEPKGVLNMNAGAGVVKKLQIVLIGIAVTVGLVGFGITTVGTIPDYAQIVVFPARGEWVPMHEAALLAYRDLIGKEEFASAISIQSTWRAVKEDTFGKIQLHDDIRNMDSWTITRHRALVLGLVFGQKKRWREDGSWIY